jgi:hypothetical protein
VKVGVMCCIFIGYKQQQSFKLHLKMSSKNTVFYRVKTAISIDFSAEEISSDGATA